MYSEALIELIDIFRGERRYNKKLVDTALTAISTAVVATRSYEARVTRAEGGFVKATSRSRDEEMRIGGLWQAAAIATRNVSPEFANRLNEKALYWLTNFPWGAEEVLARGIDWSSIDESLKELLAR